MAITNTIAKEKQKWQDAVEEEKQRAINRAVSLAEEGWNNEHVNKVNGAVKEALDLAEAAWRKEKDSAIGQFDCLFKLGKSSVGPKGGVLHLIQL